MRDVAHYVGVSQSTVSRILNGTAPAMISEETRANVLEAVRKLGYHPNLHAGSLRGYKTHMVAVMIGDISNPFFSPLVRAVQDVALAHEHDVIITNADYSEQGERRFLESMLRRPVDGAILMPAHLTQHDIALLMERTGAAVGIIGEHIHHPQADVVHNDDASAVRDAVLWMARTRGYKRIGFIAVEGTPIAQRRYSAYCEALQMLGMPLEPDWVEVGDWSPESGHAAMERILRRPRMPDALFASNDLMAIGAMKAIQRHGLRTPEDVAVMGIDDIAAASWMTPELTTIAPNPAGMGTAIAEALFARLTGKYFGPGREILVPCARIERGSA